MLDPLKGASGSVGAVEEALAVATPVLVGAMRALGDQIIKAFRGTVRRQLGPSTFKRRPAPIPSYHRSLR